jgi:thioredoxin reductase (NADPH)
LPHVNHYFKEPYAHAGQNVVVIGAKNSSAKAALSLARSGARATLVVRGAEVSESVKYWIRPDLLNRIKEGRITAYFNTTITAITPHTVEVVTPEGPRSIPTDYVYALTGYRPDYSLLVDMLALPLDESDPARPIVFDPATHETARPGVYAAGTVCGGLATSRWFIENGRHHAQLIAAAMASAPVNA